MKAPEIRPHLPTGSSYQQKIANTLPKRAPLEEIPFGNITTMLDSFGIEGDPYVSVQEPFDPTMVDRLVHESFVAVSRASLTSKQRYAIDALWQYLAEGDPLEKADLLFVFGSRSTIRAEEAVRAWKNGIAPRILFTGNRASFHEAVEETEAELSARIARAEGVPDNALLLEQESRNSPENAAFGIRLLHERAWLPKTIVLLTSSHHMRRCALTFRAALDWDARLLRYPVALPEFGPENYFLNERAWRFVFYEYIKLYSHRKMGHF